MPESDSPMRAFHSAATAIPTLVGVTGFGRIASGSGRQKQIDGAGVYATVAAGTLLPVKDDGAGRFNRPKYEAASIRYSHLALPFRLIDSLIYSSLYLA